MAVRSIVAIEQLSTSGLWLSTVINFVVPNDAKILVTKLMVIISPSTNTLSCLVYAKYGLTTQILLAPSSLHLKITMKSCIRCRSVGGYVECMIMQFFLATLSSLILLSPSANTRNSVFLYSTSKCNEIFFAREEFRSSEISTVLFFSNVRILKYFLTTI